MVHDGDDVAIIACGITVDEAARAAETLAGEGIGARVLDCYSLKPIDGDAVRAAARDCGAVITVEDHWPEGGLGDAVLEALAEADDRPPVTKLAVREMPGSGTPEELMYSAGIDAEAIAAAARGNAGPRGPFPCGFRPGGETRVGEHQGMIGRTMRCRLSCRCTVAAARLAVSACAAANGMSCLHFVPRAGSVSVFT